MHTEPTDQTDATITAAMTAREGAQQSSTLAGRLIWIGGIGLFSAVAIAAVNRLVDWIGFAVSQRSAAAALSGIVATVLHLVAWVALLVGLILLARFRGARAAFAVGMLATALVRAVVVGAVDAPLVSDWAAYHEDALAIAGGDLSLGDRPIGYPALLGGLYALLGPHVVIAEVLNAVMWLVTGALLFDLVRRSPAGGAVPAAVSIGLFAMLPSVTLMTPVVSSEATYSALLLATVWVLAVPASRLPWAALAGGLLGLTQYVRPSSFVLLPAMTALAAILAPVEHRIRIGLVLVGAFFLVLQPVVVDNLLRHGELSIATSSYGGFGLYVGTNQEAGGRFNEEDAARFAGLPGETLRERSAEAGRLGVQRILDDPGGFATLVVRKLVGMWGDDGYGAFYALEWQREPPVATGLLVAAYVSSAIGWAAVCVAGAWGVLRAGPALPAWLVAGVLLAASVSLLHAFVEVQPRYHAYLTPFWVGAAGMAIGRRWQGRTTERADLSLAATPRLEPS